MFKWKVAFILFSFVINHRTVSAEYTSTGYSDNEDSSLIVRTTKGLIRGQRVRSASGKLVDQFLSIPFAKPPIGYYRFKHPRPVDPWDNILNVTSPPNSCIQLNDTTFGMEFPGTRMWNPNTKVTEDCLQLSVWVPHPRPNNSAVLVWIFGGGFYSGTISLDLYDGRILTSEENIILVNINYRVNNLGFLYFDKGRNEAPGNAGIFDQLMGLQWVHDNIHFFGGNPNNVTLFGESAGAVSISFHLLSPLSRNLFSQAILQSGGPTVPWGIVSNKKMNQRGLLLAEAVGCSHKEEQMEQMMECLRNTDPLHLAGNETNENFGVVEFAFTPIVDGVFLDDMPEKLLERKDFKKTKLLLGSNTEEGTYFIIYHLTEAFKNSEDVYLTREDFIKSVIELTPNVNPLGQEAIVFEYTDWLNPDDPIKNRDEIDKLVGDYHFTCHVNRVANKYAATGNEVYMYYFTHRSSQNPWPKWMGTMHGDEINYVFGEPLNPMLGYTNDEIALSKRMMKSWSNFAKTGNPTLDENGIWSGFHWPLYTPHKKEYLTLATNSTAIGRGPRTQKCAFWQKYLPKLMKESARLEEESALCKNIANNVKYSITSIIAFSSFAILRICIPTMVNIWL